jgi:hypothetical protein
MEIVDMVGKRQQTETIQVNESVESIKFKNLKSGVYIIKLKTANGELQKKLMIK